MFGVIYVFVVGMVGSIVVCNRNVFFCMVIFLVLGIIVVWIVFFVMMINVLELLWYYEKKVFVVVEVYL